MKNNNKLTLFQLVKKIGREIPTIFNLDQSGKVPLWIFFDGVDCYEEQPDGSMLIVASGVAGDFRPDPNVLNDLSGIYRNDSTLAQLDSESLLDLYDSFLNTPIQLEKDGDLQPNLKNLSNYDTAPKLLPQDHKMDKQLLYKAFPALNETGEPRVLKSIIQIRNIDERDEANKPTKTSLLHHTYSPIVIGFDDLFAYEDDVDEYLRCLEEDYCIGEKDLAETFGKSYSTVKNWVRRAGFIFDRLNEGDESSSPMLKYTDVPKIKKIIKSKKSNKKI